MRSGEWLIPKLGFHKTQKAWENSGKRDILDEAREKVDQILKNHKPLPLADEIQDELNWIYKKAQEEAG
jgi:trimethylamine:corrinoid methyltransferase-like protein